MSRVLSIVANAICAGGLYTLPLLSPILVSRLKFTQPQLTTVFLAGMIGQYPLAPVVGEIIDRYGPRICSLAACIFYVLSFGGFASQLSLATDGTSHASLSSFRILVLCSLSAGLGTVSSYYSALFAASETFPEYIGIASGISMALFGLSPLFLTSIASIFFTNDSGDLSATKYMLFLMTLTGFVYLIGTLSLNGPSRTMNVSQSSSEAVDENSSLIPRESNPSAVRSSRAQEHHFPLKDPSFWFLALFCFCTLGSAEMIFSNIGTIVLSLPHKTPFPPSSSSVTAQQVQLLSLSNTITRVVTGFIADFVSPVAVPMHGIVALPRKHFVSRVFFLCCPSLLLALTFFWSSSMIKTQEDVWALSLGTGISYGAIFTLLPSIVSAIWGMDGVGRNFGILMMALFAGTSTFSYIYAFISQSHSSGGICVGRGCWRLTFWISAITSLTSAILSVVLWFRWKGRL